MINKSKSTITPSTPASHKKGIGALWADINANWADTSFGWADVQLMTNKTKSNITATNKTKTNA